MLAQHRHPIADLLDLLGRRWTLRILWELRDGPRTYGELRAACEEVSTSVLAQRLRELTGAGLVGEGYTLTPHGRELLGHLAPLNAFAKRWRTGSG